MTDWTAAALARAIAAGEMSSVEATRACLERAERLEPTLRSFITLDGERALAQARTRDAERRSGKACGPLHGVPLAHKDLCVVAGFPTSCGTRTRDYFTAARECTAVARLHAAGAVTLGKLNMSELASGPFGDNAHHGDVQNPWRVGHCAGGSSSGSGAAVAAGLALGALGTDTGGSIRLPAACCGIVGLKPTYGRVSRAGVMPLSWSLDHVGPLARTVEDAALLLEAIAGHDPHDPTTSRRNVPAYAMALATPIAGLVVGVPENYYFEGVQPEMANSVHAAAAALAGLGVAIVPVRVPDPELLVEAANMVTRAEAAAVHATLLRERSDEVQPTVRARLDLGFHVSAYEYLQAQRLRARLTREFVADLFGRVDALLAPVIPEPAPAWEMVKAGAVADIVERMGRFSRLTRPFNGLGLPALSVPCGVSADGRPLAFQLVGRPFDELTVLRLGHVYEQTTAGCGRRPSLA